MKFKQLSVLGLSTVIVFNSVTLTYAKSIEDFKNEGYNIVPSENTETEKAVTESGGTYFEYLNDNNDRITYSVEPQSEEGNAVVSSYTETDDIYPGDSFYDKGKKPTKEASVEAFTSKKHTDLVFNTIIYPDSYNWEDAFRQSLVASQFCVPFKTSLDTVLRNENSKETFSSMLDSQGLPVPLNYSPVYTDVDCKIPATVGNILEVDLSGVGHSFYQKYLDRWIEVENWDETEDGESELKSVTYEPVFETTRVYYSNPQILWYLTLFTGTSDGSTGDISSLITQFSGFKVLTDQYGNIVIDSSEGGSNARYMLVPNFMNPVLNKNNYLLENRQMLNRTPILDSSILSGEIEFKKLQEEINLALSGSSILPFSDNQFKESTRLELDVKEYSWKDSFSIPVYSNARGLGETVSPNFFKFLNTDGTYTKTVEGDLIYFSFGSDYKNTAWNILGKEGLFSGLSSGKVLEATNKQSVGFLPKDKFYKNDTFKLKETKVDVKDGKKLNTIQLYQVSNEQLKEALNQGLDYLKSTGNNANWNPSEFTKEDFNFTAYVSAAYTSKIDMEAAIRRGKRLIDSNFNRPEGAANSLSVSGTTGEKQSMSIANIILKTNEFLNSPASSLSKINTSSRSKQYKNISEVASSNYLFHVNGIFEDTGFMKILSKYFSVLLFLTFITTLMALLRVLGKDKDSLKYLGNKIVTGLILGIVPLFIMNGFVKECNFVTDKIFKNTFTYWGLVDLELTNSANATNSVTSKQQKDLEYFRETFLSNQIMDNKSSLEFYKDESWTDTKQEIITDLTSSARLTRGQSSTGDYETIMANTAQYNKSIFYYFYDTYRYHFYRYYEDKIRTDATLEKSWESPNGLIFSSGNAVKMFKDPVFLFGPTYNSVSMGDFETDKFYSATFSYLNAQDFCGFNELFSPSAYSGRTTYRDYISTSKWFTQMYNSLEMKMDNTNMLDPENYEDKKILADYYLYNVKDVTNLQIDLADVNRRMLTNLQGLQDFTGFTDEGIIVMAAIESTLEFNRMCNKNYPNEIKYLPEKFTSSNYSMDTIFRSMILDLSANNSAEIFRGDLMQALENHGGTVTQIAIIVCVFVSIFCSLCIYLSIMTFFILSCLVFGVVYTFAHQHYNKAWIGLLVLSQTLVLIHLVFLAFTSLFCVPSGNIIGAASFTGFASAIRILFLVVLMLLKSAGMLLILFFTFRHVKDFGGEVILDSARAIFSNMSGVINSSKSKIHSKSESVKVNANNMFSEGKKRVNSFMGNYEDSKVPDEAILTNARASGEKAVESLSSSSTSINNKETSNNFSSVKDTAITNNASKLAENNISKQEQGANSSPDKMSQEKSSSDNITSPEQGEKNSSLNNSNINGDNSNSSKLDISNNNKSRIGDANSNNSYLNTNKNDGRQTSESMVNYKNERENVTNSTNNSSVNNNSSLSNIDEGSDNIAYTRNNVTHNSIDNSTTHANKVKQESNTLNNASPEIKEALERAKNNSYFKD